MPAQQRKSPEQESVPQVAEGEGLQLEPDAQDLLGNAALAALVERSEEPELLGGLIEGSPMDASELMRLLGSDPEVETDSKEGMGNNGRAPQGWGTELGQHRGVPAYSNGPTSSSYGVRGTYGLMYQCVEYVNRFAVEALGLPNMTRTGNAEDYVTRRTGLTYVPNRADGYLPQPDDILVFGGGSFGHVAVVTDSSDSRVDFIHQNARSGFSSVPVQGRGQVATWGSYHLLGWQSAEGAVSVDGGAQDPGGAYTVRPGDSLSRIAARVLGDGERWAELATLNGLAAPYTLVVGQTLNLPGGDQEEAQQEAALQEAAPVQEASGQDAVYTVQSGDSLWNIAAAQLGDGERWTELARANGIRAPHHVQVGQELRLPGVQTPVADDDQSQEPAPRTYTVRPGDSLWVIAQRELGDGERWREIQAENGLRGTNVDPGQELVLPGRGALVAG